MAADGVSQRLQERRRFANPIGQCGTAYINALALKYLALAIERTAIAVFGQQNIRQKARELYPKVGDGLIRRRFEVV